MREGQEEGVGEVMEEEAAGDTVVEMVAEDMVEGGMIVDMEEVGMGGEDAVTQGIGVAPVLAVTHVVAETGIGAMRETGEIGAGTGSKVEAGLDHKICGE